MMSGGTAIHDPMKMVPLAVLQPGDVVQIGTDKACFVGRIDPHPLHLNMVLVIWRISTGGWSIDCLNPAMVIRGTSETAGSENLLARKQRSRALKVALLARLELGK